MKILNQYRIPFTGLKLGKHEFEFEIDKHFFAEFEYSIVKDGALKVFLTLDKQETMLIADFHITGIIELACDVCLSKFPSKTDISERLIVKFQEDDDGTSDITDEILILKRNEHEFDLSNNIYEYINLSVPHYARCEEQGLNAQCDKSMIDKLKNLSTPETRDTQTDPRWDILKRIKNN